MDYFWCSERGGFIPDDGSMEIPKGAAKVSEAKHAQLMAAQGKGARISTHAKTGKPVATPFAHTPESAGAVIRMEARRRILALASLEQQSNDNAQIALHALQIAHGGSSTIDAVSAINRRTKIDAIRARSNQLEAALPAMSAADLAAFDPSDDSHWSAR